MNTMQSMMRLLAFSVLASCTTSEAVPDAHMWKTSTQTRARIVAPRLFRPACRRLAVMPSPQLLRGDALRSATHPVCAGDTVVRTVPLSNGATITIVGEGAASSRRLASRTFFYGNVSAIVRNRGTESAVTTGWKLVLEVEDEAVCELELDETIPSCECVNVLCEGIEQSVWNAYDGVLPMRATIELDDPTECGNPHGRVSEGEVRWAYIE